MEMKTLIVRHMTYLQAYEQGFLSFEEAYTKAWNDYIYCDSLGGAQREEASRTVFSLANDFARELMVNRGYEFDMSSCCFKKNGIVVS